MAEPAPTGMEIADMKRMLAISKAAPLGCAVGAGEDKTLAMLLIDRVKAPKAVLKELESAFEDLANGRFGTVQAEPDGKSKTVRFTLNKPVSGFRKRLVKTLKGTGYTKVEMQF
jgi:hypothetical protein